MNDWELIATCGFGLEAVVRRELTALGYEGEVIAPGRVLFRGDAAAVCRANLWLRCADRVLIRVGHFEAKDFDALFEGTKALDWAAWIPPDGEFPVVGRSHKSQLSSVPACQRAVKRAVVDALQQQHGVTVLEETGPHCRISIDLLSDQATLTLDTTGPSLHKRGYRDYVGQAPLKETLAAALVQLSFWKPERPFWDPFCGSGTIPIEAVLWGRNIAPGLQREFAAESWPGIAESTWQTAREEAHDLRRPALESAINGTDADFRALKLARRHAERAGVADEIHFQEQAFEEISSPRKFGCVIANPPYGSRLGDEHEIEQLYRSIPKVLRRFPTWSHFILTAHPQFESLVEKQADRRRKLYNGRIECTYYQFHGPRPKKRTPESPPDADPPTTKESAPPQDSTQATDSSPGENTAEENAERKTPAQPPPQQVFGGLEEKDHEQAELFSNRLTKRARHLRRWPKRGITCFRLYDKDIPEVPLAVERYGEYLHMSEYERPHDRSPGRHADWLDLMKRTAARSLGVKLDQVFLKERHRQRGTTQHERVNAKRDEIVVEEGGLKFLVNLSDYVDTGLFLDHRVTRAMVGENAKDKRVLNLFCYTGAFSVYAAAGGAQETTSVDWSATYCDWARRNLDLNGFEPPRHRVINQDVREFLHQRTEVTPYDIAVIDPPTFSNSKRTDDDWIVQRDYAEIINLTFKRMSPGGVIYFSTNFRRFKLDESALEAKTIHEISRQTVPDDFRNRRIHRCWRIVAPGGSEQ